MDVLNNLNELEELGRQIVSGSTAQIDADQAAELEFLRLIHSDSTDQPDLHLVFSKYAALRENRWKILPDGVEIVIDGVQQRTTLSDFIGGIASAANRVPLKIDVDTVIFFVGKHMASIKPEEVPGRNVLLRSMFVEG